MLKEEKTKIEETLIPSDRRKRNKAIVALFIFFFIVFFAISFASFITNWKSDQSKIELDFWSLFSDKTIIMENVSGKFGAWLCNLLFYNTFGVASFILIGWLVIPCFHLFGYKKVPFFRSLKIAVLSTIWLSLFLGIILFDYEFLWGGAHGRFVGEWVQSLLGLIGCGLFLVLTICLLFGFIFKDLSMSILNNYFNKKLVNLSKNIEESIESANKKEYVEDTTSLIHAKKSEEVDMEVEKPTGIEENIRFFEKNEDVKLNEFDIERFQHDEERIDIIPADKTKENDIDLAVKGRGDEDLTDENLPDTLFDPTLELSNYKYPILDLLEEHTINESGVTDDELKRNKDKIVETLGHYGIEIVKIKATIGPTITLYEINPAPGIRISKIKSLENDIAMSLKAEGIRIIAPMPGKGTIGIEVPNEKPDIVSMRTILASKKFQESKYELPIAIGKNISNETFVFDLAKSPHILMAGATGQGKSVGLNVIVASLLYKKHPAELKFVMIDPKKVELSLYEGLQKHFLAKEPNNTEIIINDTKKVINTMNSLCVEMDDRYNLLKAAQCKNIVEYNAKFKERRLNPNKGHKFLPYIVVIIDEFADLIMTAGKEVEMPIARIAQLARAVGIHMVIATQRPSTTIITGNIKANFPSRVAFRVSQMVDSRTILDSPGANQLIGRGDMLISLGSDKVRLQCAFLDTSELEAIVKHIGSQQGYFEPYILPEYITEEDFKDLTDIDLSKRDDLFEEAARMVVTNNYGSTSMIQRKMSIGFVRAGRIMDELEKAGIVGAAKGSKTREVLITNEMDLDAIFNRLR